MSKALFVTGTGTDCHFYTIAAVQLAGMTDLVEKYLVIIGAKLLHEPVFTQETAGCQYHNGCLNFLMLAVLLHPDAAAPVIGILQNLFGIAV